MEHRLSVAKELGADFTLQVKPDEHEKDVTKRIVDLLGSNPQITIDCSGFQGTIRLAMEVSCALCMFEILFLGSNKFPRRDVLKCTVYFSLLVYE